MPISRTAAKRPPVHLVDSEADAISNLAWNIRDRSPDVCVLLLEEIERARLCKRSALPADVVTMFSQVDYVDERSGAERRVELVYPSQADALLGRISILTLVGAGLIGLKAGHAICWPDREGRRRNLTITAVRQPDRGTAIHV